MFSLLLFLPLPFSSLFISLSCPTLPNARTNDIHFVKTSPCCHHYSLDQFHLLRSAAVPLSAPGGRSFIARSLCADCFRAICSSSSSVCYAVMEKSRSWQVTTKRRQEAVIKCLTVGERVGQIGGKKIEGCYKGPLEL
jgi:hypothetical protein